MWVRQKCTRGDNTSKTEHKFTLSFHYFWKVGVITMDRVEPADDSLVPAITGLEKLVQLKPSLPSPPISYLLSIHRFWTNFIWNNLWKAVLCLSLKFNHRKVTFQPIWLFIISPLIINFLIALNYHHYRPTGQSPARTLEVTETFQLLALFFLLRPWSLHRLKTITFLFFTIVHDCGRNCCLTQYHPWKN